MVAKKSRQAIRMNLIRNAPKGSQTTQPGKPGVKNPDTGEVVTPPVDDVTKYGPVDGDPITSTEETFDKTRI